MYTVLIDKIIETGKGLTYVTIQDIGYDTRIVQKQTSCTSKENKALIIDDIRKIQLASSKSTFELMASLFVKKWQHNESNFVDYFKKND